MQTVEISNASAHTDGKKIRALVIGHTGATGKALLDTLIASPHCESIIAIGRRESIEHKGMPKLTQHVVDNMLDIAHLPLHIGQGGNAAFGCIGTAFNDVFKKKKAAEYRSTDFGITTEFAKYAQQVGVDFFSFISGQGANAKSKFNMFRVKGEAEEFIHLMKFKQAAFLRPGSLNRGADATWTEQILTLGGLTGLPVSRLAEAMVWMALNQVESMKPYEHKEIKQAALNFKNLSVI